MKAIPVFKLMCFEDIKVAFGMEAIAMCFAKSSIRRWTKMGWIEISWVNGTNYVIIIT